MSTHLNLDLIRTDGGTQPRLCIDFDAVDDYILEMRAGTIFPPLIVFFDGSHYWLADGFHRYKAAEQSGVTEIACDIRQGTQQDAQWYSFGANKTNGLRRTNDDKQRAVKAALVHPLGAGKSNVDIAAHVGVDEGTVRNWRQKLTSEIPKCPMRTGRDGRTINVSNIDCKSAVGHGSPAAPLPIAPGPATMPSVCQVPAPAGTPGVSPVSGSAVAAEWNTRIVQACVEIANCPVSPDDLAIKFAPTTQRIYFEQMEKAHDYIAAILKCRERH